MIPVRQTIFHEEKIIKGNCLQAALASILEISISDVPDFEGDDWYIQLMEWLEILGFELVRWDGEGYNFKGYYLITGQSPRGNFKHIVVYKNGVMVHDPHPSNLGLLEQESTWVLLPLDPSNSITSKKLVQIAYDLITNKKEK